MRLEEMIEGGSGSWRAGYEDEAREPKGGSGPVVIDGAEAMV